MTAALTELEERGRVQLTPDVWVLHFAYPSNPIPMNGPKANWRARVGVTARIKGEALRRALAARMPEMGKCRAQLTWWVNTNRKRDVDNLALFEKPLFDALVMAGIVRDDTPDLMDKPRPRIRHVDESAGLVSKPGFTLHITRLTPEEEF